MASSRTDTRPNTKRGIPKPGGYFVCTMCCKYSLELFYVNVIISISQFNMLFISTQKYKTTVHNFVASSLKWDITIYLLHYVYIGYNPICFYLDDTSFPKCSFHTGSYRSGIGYISTAYLPAISRFTINYKIGSCTYVTGLGCNILATQTYNLFLNYWVTPVHSLLPPETTGGRDNGQFPTDFFWSP